MPAIQYPFIDIAVHPRVRERFARGEAMVLFSTGLDRVLWANGAGADLFGYDAIYDFLDQGPRPGDVSFRQIAATAHQLAVVGDARNFLVRMAAGFRRTVVNAAVEMIRVQSGEEAILFSAPVSAKPLSADDSARRMLDGFDDPDTHMAVIGRDGEVIAASERFAALGITPQTAKMLVTMAGAQPDRLIKRPIPTGRGYLPAALGKLSETPALHLLFVVETVIGHLDPTETFEQQAPAVETAPAPEPEATAIPAAASALPAAMVAMADHAPAAAPASAAPFADVLDAVAGIEDVEDEPEELPATDEIDTNNDAPAESNAAADDLDALALADGATPQDIETTGHEDLTGASGDEPAALPPKDEEEAHPDEEMTEETAGHVAGPGPDVAQAVEPAAPAGEPAAPLDIAEAPVAGTDAAEASKSEIVDATADNTPQGFAFKPNGRATRFVWKIDAEGRFSEISREFAEAVGPHATNIAGVAFTDIAALFNLDPDGKIADLLARRDTWSGRTIHWPVEGTSLMVPVDLAALPTYTRNRDFDGFRGFGVVRLSDAVEDPMKLGLTLAPAAAAEESEPVAEAPVDADPVAEAENPPLSDTIEAEPLYAEPEAAVVEAVAEDTASESPVEAMAAPPTDDEGHGDTAEAPVVNDEEPELPLAVEPPALTISETPNRRLSDKIIQLHQHRPTIREGLSASEQAAFREIARQLEPFGKSAEQPVEESPEAAGTEPAANAVEAIPAGNSVAEGFAAATEETVQAEDVAETLGTVSGHSAGDDDVPGSDHEDGAQDGHGREHTFDAAAEPEEDFNPLDVLTTAIPPRVKMTSGLSAEIVDQMPVALLVHAGDRLIHANPELLRLTGYETLADIEKVGGLDALLQRHDLEGKTERPGAMMVVRADDALVPVTARLQSIRWEEGSALMLALMPVEKDEGAAQAGQSVEGREEARPERMLEKVAKLQVEVEELQSILETATDGVVIIGQEGDIRSMNRSASALFNYDDQETRGKPFVMLFAHESQKAVLDYLNGLSGHGVASVLNDGREVIGREASGGFVPLFMTMGKLTSSNGYCAVIRDITQWKRTEEELRNAKRAAETANAHKSDFLARVSHEIRTPLNAIIGFSDMMAGERFGPIGHSRYVEYANDIGRSGRHVLDIVNDLLDISKIEAGEMDLEFASVGLNEAIAEAVSLVQPQANSQRVIIRTALSQAVPNVVADLRSIKQIALNILSNAIRFTPSGGQIVVSTSYEGNGSVVMRIRDTGVGMTRSELEQAMKPFRQVSTNSRKRGDGTGLGLPLTKAMVDANRATFSINSSPNEGTLVEVTFPSPRVLAN